MSSNVLRLATLILRFVLFPSDRSYSQEDSSRLIDTSYIYIDTVCTIPYLNETNITGLNYPLVVKSKEAILTTGISETYFNEHFSLLCAVDNYAGGSHRLVRWRYNVGEYSTVLTDNIGTIQYDLKGVREIRKVISLKKAKRKMRWCVGEFKGAFVFLGHSPSNDKQTKLFLVARSIKEIRGIDVSWEIGYVDLETGNCEKTKGGAIHSPVWPIRKGLGDKK